MIEEFNNYTALNIENFLLPVKNMVMVSSDYQTNEQVLSMIKHNSIFLLNALDKVKQSLDTLHVDESASAVMEAWNKTKEMVDKKVELLKHIVEKGFNVDITYGAQQRATEESPEESSCESDSHRNCQTTQKAYSVEEKRRTHAQAYAKWTPEVDAELAKLYDQGMDIHQLTEHFGRNEGAIRSRLKKIGKA